MEDYEYSWEPHEICTVNKETGEITNLFHVEEFAEHCEQALPYKDIIIVTLDSGVYVYNESGELISEAESLSLEDYGQYCGTAISEDKLYLYEVGQFDDWKYHFYSCPIDDILNGQGEWKYEYSLYM